MQPEVGQLAMLSIESWRAFIESARTAAHNVRLKTTNEIIRHRQYIRFRPNGAGVRISNLRTIP